MQMSCQGQWMLATPCPFQTYLSGPCSQMEMNYQPYPLGWNPWTLVRCRSQRSLMMVRSGTCPPSHWCNNTHIDKQICEGLVTSMLCIARQQLYIDTTLHIKEAWVSPIKYTTNLLLGAIIFMRVVAVRHSRTAIHEWGGWGRHDTHGRHMLMSRCHRTPRCLHWVSQWSMVHCSPDATQHNTLLPSDYRATHRY